MSRQGGDQSLEQDGKIFDDEICCSNDPEEIPEGHVSDFRNAKVEAASKQIHTLMTSENLNKHSTKQYQAQETN